MRSRLSRSARPKRRAAVLDGRRTVHDHERSRAISPVPDGHGQPGAARGAERAAGGVGVAAVVEEPVDGRAGAADVGSERAEPEQLRGERRGGEVVRRQRGEVARAADGGERALERGPALLPAVGPSALVEAAVDRGGGGLRRRRAAGRARSSSPAAGRAARARRRRRGRAGGRRRGRTGRRRRARDASACSSSGGAGSVERLVGEPERGRRVGAAAAEAGRDRDPLRDRRLPARLDAGRRGERGERVADDRVAAKPVTASAGASAIATRSPRSTRWRTVATSCFPSSRPARRRARG